MKFILDEKRKLSTNGKWSKSVVEENVIKTSLSERWKIIYLENTRNTIEPLNRNIEVF